MHLSSKVRIAAITNQVCLVWHVVRSQCGNVLFFHPLPPGWVFNRIFEKRQRRPPRIRRKKTTRRKKKSRLRRSRKGAPSGVTPSGERLRRNEIYFGSFIAFLSTHGKNQTRKSHLRAELRRSVEFGCHPTSPARDVSRRSL